MFVFVCFFLSAAETSQTFVGNWTKGGEEIDEDDDPPRFQIALARIENVTNLTLPCYYAITFFKNTSSMKGFPHARYRFIGFSDLTNRSFVLFHFPKQINQTERKVWTEIDEYLYEYDDFFISNMKIREDVVTIAESHSILGEVMVLAFVIEESSLSDKAFRLPFNITGTILCDAFFVDFKGFLFDVRNYLIAGKDYGVLSSVCMLMNFYAWFSLRRARTATMLNQLSLHSLIMHTGFEFSYGLFLLNVGFSFSGFRRIFTLLFCCSVLMYFTFQMTLISNVWKTSNDLGELEMPEIRMLFVRFFGEMSILIFSSLFSVVLMLEYPFVPLLYLYSSFVPQIVLNIKRAEKKKTDSVFTILTTFQRLIQLWYLFLYRDNIIGSYSIFSGIFFTFYGILLMVVVLMQNKYGGAFLLPKRYRRRGFDYFARHVDPNSECSICMADIYEGEEAMVTPCAHAFHRECLDRWMQEQMVCPVCRAALPPANMDSSDDETVDQ